MNRRIKLYRVKHRVNLGRKKQYKYVGSKIQLKESRSCWIEGANFLDNLGGWWRSDEFSTPYAEFGLLGVHSLRL